MNKVILIGRVCADAEPKQTTSGTSVSRYRLAVDRPGKQGEEKTADFIPCLCFGKSADFANKYLKKGMKIAVEGSIRTGSYEKDGVKHYTTDIIVDRHEFCENKQSSTSSTSPAPDVTYPAPTGTDDFQIMDDGNDDLPF